MQMGSRQRGPSDRKLNFIKYRTEVTERVDVVVKHILYHEYSFRII
jgi:hypothetical protein